MRDRITFCHVLMTSVCVIIKIGDEGHLAERCNLHAMALSVLASRFSKQCMKCKQLV